MSNIYITSDWHFSHDKPFVYASRGFSTIEEMNEAIIQRHNSIVGLTDIVYVLGDCCLGGANSLSINQSLIERLNGELHIILGNHCTSAREAMYTQCKNVKSVEGWGHLIKYQGYHFLLTHFPTLTGNMDDEKPLKQRLINLHGHVHSNTNFNDNFGVLCYHVGVDSHDCKPVLLDDIINEIKAKVLE